MREARWFVQKDASGRNKEIVCYKAPGNVGAYGGDILFIKFKTYDWDDDFNIIPESGEWYDTWDYLYLTESRNVSNGKDCVYEIKGNIFEHPYLLKYLPDCFVDGVVNRIGSPRFEGSRDDYFNYITSHAWKRKKAEIIHRDNGTCAICGAKHTTLHVHHLSYEHFEDERDGELITLCADCHSRLHKECDKFYLAVSKLPICERIGNIEYSRLFELCADAHSFYDEEHIAIFVASVLGVEMEKGGKYWRGEQEFTSSFNSLVALFDIIHRRLNGVGIKCHRESEIRAILKMGDELGFHWFDSSNPLASCGIYEIAGHPDTDKLHFPDEIVLNFDCNVVTYNTFCDHVVDASTILKYYNKYGKD